MKVRRTATVSAVSAALVLGAPLAAFASEGEAAPVAGPGTTTEAPAPDVAEDAAPDAVEGDEGGAGAAPAAPADDAAPAPVDPVVAPAPEEVADAEPAAPAAEDDGAADEPAAEDATPATGAPAEEGTTDESATEDVTTGAPATDEVAEDAGTEDAGTDDGEQPAEPAAAPVTGASATGVAVASTLPGVHAAYPDAEYAPHWHDGYYEGFPCDYWYFQEPSEGGSGKDWSGWSGQPQLHILHHELVDEDGTTHMVYDRDIAGSWWHAWNGEVAHADPEGMHWENTDAHQTILVNGFTGGADMTARAANATELLDRAGVSMVPGQSWESFLANYQWSLDQGYYTEDQVHDLWEEQNQRRAEYTAYEATQFAVWYFSTGHDVMGLFFDVDEDDHVTLSDFALQQFQADEWGNAQWGYGQSDRRATMETAAWLIEKALTENVVMPQPGFVSNGFVRHDDGSTDYGFTASLVGGTGDVHVELRTADGSAMPAGVVLVDAQGRVVSSVTPGQKVFVRVPAGTDVASLPAFQLWGSAEGTTKGSPNFYTGQDLNSSAWDEASQTWIQSGQQHWLIGLGGLDSASVAWDWIGVTLADEPEDPTDPTDPTETGDTDPVAPVYVDGNGTVVTDVVTSADPVNLGLTDTRPVADVARTTAPDALATTGADAALLAAGAFIVLAGTGLVLATRRRTDAR